MAYRKNMLLETMHPWHIIWLFYILFLHPRNDSFTLTTQKRIYVPYVCHTWFSILSCSDLINQLWATDVFIILLACFKYTLWIWYTSAVNLFIFYFIVLALVILRFRNNLCQSYAIFGTAQNRSLCKFWRFLPHTQSYLIKQAGK